MSIMKLNIAVNDVEGQKIKFAGIDYGSKFAGTTVICFARKLHLTFLSSEKKQDADRMIIDFCQQTYPEMLFIDAPLSLPLCYSQTEVDKPDFFYRQCDREMKAMSPLFLGGLTARAMRLKHQLREKQIKMIESYPGGIAKELNFRFDLKERLAVHLSDSYKLELDPDTIINQHHFDAALAYLIGLRFQRGVAKTFGVETEGLIYI